MIMLLLTSIAAWSMLAHDIGDRLKSMEEYTGEIIECNDGSVDADTCAKRWSQLAVYRVFFGTTLFFAFMSLLTCRVESSKDIRAGFQNGFWLVKILIWIGLIVAAFYIDNAFFEEAFGVIGLIGAFLFMLVQGVYLIIFANYFQQSFISAEENAGCTRCCVPSTTLFLFAAAIAITVCLFVFYTDGHGLSDDDCETNKVLISFNFVMMFVMAFISVRSQAAERGLFQAIVVSFYTTYLTWSALSNTAGSVCQPLDYDSSEWLTSAIGYALAIFVIGGVSNLKRSGGTNPEPRDDTLPTTVSKGGAEQEVQTTDAGEKVLLIRVYPVTDNEQDAVYYNWSLFHLTLTLACLYLMNVLTDWAAINDGGGAQIAIGKSDAPMWVQVTASWITMLLYIWTVGAPYIGPAICPCRDWGTIDA